MKNYLGHTLRLLLLLAALLTGLSLLPPELPLGGWTLRKMDIFSDIRATPLTADSSAQDSLLLFPDSLVAQAPADSSGLDSLGLIPEVDTAFFGKIFEDYTPEQQGLRRFFAAVDSIRRFGRTVRVAFFGDSFVEGDILLGDLRDTLQTRWGGEGVGYVPVTSEVARFKRTLVHRYEGWQAFSIVKNHDSGMPFGINGFVYRPREQASVFYEGADYFKHTRYWSCVRLFYQTLHDAPFVWQSQNQPPQADVLPARTGTLNVWKHATSDLMLRSFEARFEQPDSTLLLYGASLENGPGFYLDNFSVRGNTGGRLRLIRPELARQFDALQRYDLIVVQLGLNAVTPRMDNIRWYRAELEQTFAHLRRCFPGKLFLLVSVADRAGNIDGELRTLPSVPAITAMQRDLARRHGFLFLDLLHAMGGPGAMVGFANRKPALANKDYTHLTHEGGKMMGHLFAKLFFEAQSDYWSVQKNETR